MQTLAEHPAAADLLLRRYLLLERQAGCATQFTGRLLHHYRELAAQCPGVSLGKIPGSTNVHVGQVGGHLPADAPDLADIHHLQEPVALFRLSDVHDPTALPLP